MHKQNDVMCVMGRSEVDVASERYVMKEYRRQGDTRRCRWDNTICHDSRRIGFHFAGGRIAGFCYDCNEPADCILFNYLLRVQNFIYTHCLTVCLIFFLFFSFLSSSLSLFLPRSALPFSCHCFSCCLTVLGFFLSCFLFHFIHFFFFHFVNSPIKYNYMKSKR